MEEISPELREWLGEMDYSSESFLQTEYKYCYDLVLHYVLHYLHKDDGRGDSKEK